MEVIDLTMDWSTFSLLQMKVYERWAELESPKTPLTCFPLHIPDGRKQFLAEFTRWGEPALFEAVGHLWNSLKPPKAFHAAAIAQAAGISGSGKSVLSKFLMTMLVEALSLSLPVPQPEAFESMEEWNVATIQTFAAEHAHHDDVIERYAAHMELPNEAAIADSGLVIVGPWSSPNAGITKRRRSVPPGQPTQHSL
ncbi:hypothetical protein ACUXST_000411 [Sphingomonas sp. F9_3S_D5_B_2]